MVSELFFYIRRTKVGRYFAEIPLTHTVTHITIEYSGQGSTEECILAVKPEIAEKLSEISL
jgi:hypothetical protein